MTLVRAELFLLAAGLGLFLLSLLWLTALLSIARQMRIRLSGRSPEMRAAPAASPHGEAPTIPTLPASLRLALREAAPGDVTRLIAYLREESAKPASTAQAS